VEEEEDSVRWGPLGDMRRVEDPEARSARSLRVYTSIFQYESYLMVVNYCVFVTEPPALLI
jgi:hypothetical protein